VVAQGVAICATTILQEETEDSYRGRVFALYDMLFNVPFVVGAVIAAEFIPATGKSYPLILAAAVGYLAAAALYALASRQDLLPGAGGGGSAVSGEGSCPDASPSASAQRRNS
jgi:MFS family permease